MKKGLSSCGLLAVCWWRMETLGNRAAGMMSVLGKREGLCWTSGRSVPSLLAQRWGCGVGAVPGMSEVLPGCARGCPPARRELSSSSPGGEPTSGC